MKVNYHERIVNVLPPGKYLSFQEIANRVYGVGNKHHALVNDAYYKAWQDLTNNGKITEGINNTYRINL